MAKRLSIHAPEKKLIHLLLFFALVALTIFYFIYFETGITQKVMARDLEGGMLTPAQSKSIDAVLDLSHLMIGWSIATIGATAYFMKLHTDRNSHIHMVDLYLSIAIIVLCVSSIYFGHLGIDFIAIMLSLNQFPVGTSLLKRMLANQYLTLISAVGLFGIHIVQYFWRQLK